MKVLFATTNPAKINKYANGLKEKGIELLTLKDLKIDLNVEENGKNAIENARIKAKAYYNIAKIPTIGMDNNLYIEELPEEKQPGTHVRRVNGKELNDDEMIEYYSNLVKEYGVDGKLIARYVYGMAIISTHGEVTYTWNKSNFWLVDTPSKIINPGYPLNSISKNIKLDKYFSEMTKEDHDLVQEQEDDVIDFIANNV